MLEQQQATGFVGFLKKHKWLIVAVIVAATIALAPAPNPVEFGGKTIVLTPGGQKMLALLVFLVISFITEAFPLGATIGIIYAWIVLSGVVEPDKAAKLFANDVNWFLVGALMIAAVLVKYKIHKRVLVLILKIFGTKTKILTLGIMIFASIASAFIADHTVAALLLPIAIAIVEASGGFKKSPNLAKYLLFAIAFSASIGGLATITGGSRNIIMVGYLKQFYDVNISYLGWMAMAVPVLLLLLPIAWFLLSMIFKPEVLDLKDTISEIKSEMSISRVSFKEIAVLLIFLGILLMWIFAGEGKLGLIAILGGSLFLIFGFVEWSDYRDLSWDIILLYFAVIGLGVALNDTGAASWVAAKGLQLVTSVLPLTPTVVSTMGIAVMALATQIMSDGPAVATVGPILLELGKLMGLDPVRFGVSVAIASSFAFMLIIGTPPNAIVYSSGYLKAKDFVKAGFGVFIASLLILWVIVPIWWNILGVGVNGFH